MSFQRPITIADAINRIRDNNYLLPGLQREFVWKREKIEWLFDSIMQGYPIGSFLFWGVKGETKNKFRFYKFIREYKVKYKTHNEEIETEGISDFTAVLDGQQRLGSLYIGLCGSYAYKRPRQKDEDNRISYPERELYVNIVKKLEDDKKGRKYEFEFKTKDEGEENRNKWFRVRDILGLSTLSDLVKYSKEHEFENREVADEVIGKLSDVVFKDDIINYFLVEEQDIDKSLNIFIRMNSGGEKLSFSDLIMSIATTNWEKRDARKEIHSLVTAVRNKDFTISKDIILKCFLYLHSRDIGFTVKNFSRSNAKEFEEKWDRIYGAILSVCDLVKSFGFSDKTLIAKNALLPIIYYVYHMGIYKDFSQLKKYEKDRKRIRKWLHVCLVKGLVSASSDTALSQMRRVFREDGSKKPIQETLEIFPSEKIDENLKQKKGVSDEFIEELLNTQKDDKKAFSLLALMYPHLDYRNNDFHMDHLHPSAKYEELSEENKKKHGKKTYNSLKNLQLLDGNENSSKGDKDLKIWAQEQTQGEDRKAFLKKHLIPKVDLTLDNFDNFITKRTDLLSERLKEILS